MIHVLGEGRDAKGISLKITYNTERRQTTVIVWKGETMRTETFESNRFGFHLGDSVKALGIADRFADELEKELSL
jgi:hypothetical protein